MSARRPRVRPLPRHDERAAFVRKLILKMSISVAGFVGGLGGKIDWIFKSSSEDSVAWTIGVIEKAGAHLMGSRTFHDMAAYWPTSSGPFAPPMNNIPKVVFSRKGLAGPDADATTGALKDASAHIPIDPSKAAQGAQSWADPRVMTCDLAEGISQLKAEPGGDLVAHGGASFAASLIAAGLVDEYDLLVHPVILVWACRCSAAWKPREP
jgi:dihydrofolate reductase